MRSAQISPTLPPDLDRAGEEDLAGRRLAQRLADRAAAVDRPHEALGKARVARRRRWIRSPSSGVRLAGLSTTPLPAIRAIATSPKGIDHG